MIQVRSSGHNINQVGNAPTGSRYIKALDEQLHGIKAKFDICDTLSIEEMKQMTLSEVLQKAISD